MLKDIVEVRWLGDHKLYLRFEDGVDGILDFHETLRFDGVFESLRDPNRFAEVTVNPEWGTIVWPNGADLAPDTLYAQLTNGALA